MKKIALFLCMLTTLLYACESGNNHENVTSINVLSKTSANVGSGNAVGIISYEIINPIAGYTVEATANVEWIHSFDYSAMGKIGYKIDANTTYTERVGVITVSYNNSSVDITLTQEGKVRPEEIMIEAPYLLGHYFGDYAKINYNYYLVFSESDYDASGSFYREGYKYFVDIYSEERPEDYSNIRVPNGVYTFNPDNDGRAGTFLEAFSIYKEYDAAGMEVAEHKYEEGTLTVTDDLVKLEIKFMDEDNLRVVTFSNDYVMQDRRNDAGGIY